MIEVRYRIDAADRDPQLWETKLYNALKSAGIPVSPDGRITEDGVLDRYDDPKDWGLVIYQWRTRAELRTNGE